MLFLFHLMAKSTGVSRWADENEETKPTISQDRGAESAITKEKVGTKKKKRMSVVDIGATMAFDGDDDFLDGF